MHFIAQHQCLKATLTNVQCPIENHFGISRTVHWYSLQRCKKLREYKMSNYLVKKILVFLGKAELGKKLPYLLSVNIFLQTIYGFSFHSAEHKHLSKFLKAGKKMK